MRNIAWMVKPSLLLSFLLTACGLEGSPEFDAAEGASTKNEIVEISIWEVEWIRPVIYTPDGTESELLENRYEIWLTTTEQIAGKTVRTARYCSPNGDESVLCPEEAMAVVGSTVDNGIHFTTERILVTGEEDFEWRDSFILGPVDSAQDGTAFRTGDASEAQWLGGEPYAKFVAQSVWRDISSFFTESSSSIQGFMGTFSNDSPEWKELSSKLVSSKQPIR